MSETGFVAGLNQENAILLLAAAEESGLGQEVVLTTENGFIAPLQVLDLAFPAQTPLTED